MNIDIYASEIDQLLDTAKALLLDNEKLVVYSLNIGTDISSGASVVSVDTHSNSLSVVKGINEWRASELKDPRLKGLPSLINELSQPISRNCDPAVFLYDRFAGVHHRDWRISDMTEQDLWSRITPILVARQREIARWCNHAVLWHHDAEVSISTADGWYELPMRIAEAE